MRTLFRVKSDLKTSRELTSEMCIAIIALLFLFAHLFFAIYYYVLRVYSMSIINFLSVLIYIFINRYSSKYADSSSLIMIVEVGIYCVICTYFVGWDAGTHNYLPILIFPCYLLFNLPRRRSMLYTLIIVLSMTLCVLINYTHEHIYTEIDFSSLPFVNVIICMAGATAVVVLLDRSSRSTESYYNNRIENLSVEANKDALTQMWNRRYVQKHVLPIYATEESQERAFVSIFDIDFFKTVNDTYGHGVGDEVLKFLADQILDSFRRTDTAARWGGEEFLVILDNTDEKGAFYALDNFRKKIESTTIFVGTITINIQVTAGFCKMKGCESFAKCIQNADDALYYGKRNGRNQIINYNDMPDQTPIN